jgi:hypothetical protein
VLARRQKRKGAHTARPNGLFYGRGKVITTVACAAWLAMVYAIIDRMDPLLYPVFRIIIVPLALLAFVGCMMIWTAVANRGHTLIAGKPDFSRQERAVIVCLGLVLVSPFVLVIALICL